MIFNVLFVVASMFVVINMFVIANTQKRELAAAARDRHRRQVWRSRDLVWEPPPLSHGCTKRKGHEGIRRHERLQDQHMDDNIALCQRRWAAPHIGERYRDQRNDN